MVISNVHFINFILYCVKVDAISRWFKESSQLSELVIDSKSSHCRHIIIAGPSVSGVLKTTLLRYGE